MASAAHGLSTNEALSGIFGSISITSWICLLIPQLITNYKTKSADGLSMLFLAVWLFGDVTNLSGALVTGLAPTATVLAAYFCVSDLILISQCVYYNTINARAARRRAQSSATDISEDEPLLRRQRTGSSTTAVALPGSQRRRSSGREINPIKRVITGEDETPSGSAWLHNTLGITAIWVVGTAGWFLSYRAGAFDQPEADVPEDLSPDTPVAILGMVMGYTSAICYLCARIPQIIKNYREKSCEGLALLFFMLSLTGNLTYGLSVFSYSQEPQYIIKAIPWLLGSLGTIVEDCIIFYQFRIYSQKSEHAIDDSEEAS
ncbi:PQ loop repeat-domain-containing protein [Microdochium trichocladiopsis]|uniref:PQ loop repeat-domain-containing protein n=1 Tax=Microdochium trichocladiopsis TaxID=1682393 RepID=A0A9P9BXU9_9PEZI|nr:PQ loop repeat-domain-containing protein [Microdochium trichocladiopsis]KAH7037408.1 PQ loop repeat-domain-containing protein [Microdochium trichocladiopsis]